MTTTKIEYAADAALTVTLWTTTLLAGEYAPSGIFANGTTKYVDVLVGGGINLNEVTPVAGNTLEIYVLGQYSDTATDMTGGIDARLVTSTELVANTDFVLANLPLLAVVNIEVTTPATQQIYHWGPVSVAGAFGGTMPKNFMLILRNNTAAPLDALADVNTIGITYTHA